MRVSDYKVSLVEFLKYEFQVLDIVSLRLRVRIPQIYISRSRWKRKHAKLSLVDILSFQLRKMRLRQYVLVKSYLYFLVGYCKVSASEEYEGRGEGH